MENIHLILNIGQVVKLSDSSGSSWSFGIKFLLAGNRVLCEWLNGENDSPSREASDFKLSVPHEGGIYMVPVRTVGISRDGREYKFLLHKEYEVIQRRDYYRLPNPHVSVECRILGQEMRDVEVVDISGGGIGLVIDRAIKEGTVVEMEITTPDGTTISANGRAVHVSKVEDEDNYSIGINFIKISRADRALIIKYVFEEQVLISKEESNIAIVL